MSKIEVTDSKTILYKELSFKIMEACFEVHNSLGPGFAQSHSMAD